MGAIFSFIRFAIVPKTAISSGSSHSFNETWEIVEVLAVEAPREVEEEAEDDLKSLHPMHHELILQFKYLWKIYLQLPKYPKSKNTFQAWDRSK